MVLTSRKLVPSPYFTVASAVMGEHNLAGINVCIPPCPKMGYNRNICRYLLSHLSLNSHSSNSSNSSTDYAKATIRSWQRQMASDFLDLYSLHTPELEPNWKGGAHLLSMATGKRLQQCFGLVAIYERVS